MSYQVVESTVLSYLLTLPFVGMFIMLMIVLLRKQGGVIAAAASERS
jgi:hypothetical protein